MLLGIDVGTTRLKAVAIDAGGAVRAGAAVPTPFTTTADGVEMPVADLGRALAEVIAALGPLREEVAAVGLAGMAESGAPLRAGRPLAPVIAWHDGRGEETVASLQVRFGADLPRWTGRRVRTVSSVAKLGWLLDHGLPEPDRWLGVPELALFLLTGAEVTEHSLAARTGAYSVSERRWLPEVIDHVIGATGRARRREAGGRLGPGAGPGEGAAIGPVGGPGEGAAIGGLFPPVRAAGAVMGRIGNEAGAEYGLPAGIPVTIAGHDHLAAAAGLGAGPGDLLNSVGTAETVLRRLDAAPDVDRALELDLAVTLWPGGDAWAVLASATRAGPVVEALAADLGVAPGDLDGLTGAAAERWIVTTRTLAGSTAAAAGRIAALAGPHQRLVVFGGGSRSPVWLRAKAAAVGVPVVRGPAEAAARGAALAAGVAAGWWATPPADPTPAGGRN
ncbi:MAG TPA: FGGY family carbohydrate kinase, partial [Acidimicrobiia bacterium]|nr:FGGY family carbohydrate kinase [Acidimicrobiia bacterium]